LKYKKNKKELKMNNKTQLNKDKDERIERNFFNTKLDCKRNENKNKKTLFSEELVKNIDIFLIVLIIFIIMIITTLALYFGSIYISFIIKLN
jgi:hypothetical protein